MENKCKHFDRVVARVLDHPGRSKRQLGVEPLYGWAHGPMSTIKDQHKCRGLEMWTHSIGISADKGGVYQAH